ncbi:MAG: hypothetical protein IKE91_02815 [Clostridia bacterium]|nr:hypothetical protein [Clostridia bacterium]
MKTLDMAKTRLETLKQESITAVESGKFSKEPADSMGITPQQRLEWVAPSIDYIFQVAAGLPEKEIEAALNSIVDGDIVMAFIATVEVLSKDCYVTEGKGNVEKAREILKANDAPTRGPVSDDEDGDGDEPVSVMDRIVNFFTADKPDKGKKAKKKKKPATETIPVPDVRLEKPESLENPEVKKLKAENAELEERVDELEAALVDMRQRATNAEREVNKLKAKYESPLS